MSTYAIHSYGQCFCCCVPLHAEGESEAPIAARRSGTAPPTDQWQQWQTTAWPNDAHSQVAFKNSRIRRKKSSATTARDERTLEWSKRFTNRLIDAPVALRATGKQLGDRRLDTALRRQILASNGRSSSRSNSCHSNDKCRIFGEATLVCIELHWMHCYDRDNWAICQSTKHVFFLLKSRESWIVFVIRLFATVHVKRQHGACPYFGKSSTTMTIANWVPWCCLSRFTFFTCSKWNMTKIYNSHMTNQNTWVYVCSENSPRIPVELWTLVL